MQQIDYKFIIESVIAMEQVIFDDCWSTNSIWDAMKYDYNSIYFLFGTPDLYTIYLLNGESLKIDMLIRGDVQGDGFKEGCPMGYIICNEVEGETELLRIAISDMYRKNKLGVKLLSVYLEDKKNRCSNFFLEVRKGNLPARTMYEKLAYKELGVRKKYYTNPVEDAVIYGINLNN